MCTTTATTAKCPTCGTLYECAEYYIEAPIGLACCPAAWAGQESVQGSVLCACNKVWLERGVHTRGVHSLILCYSVN